MVVWVEVRATSLGSASPTFSANGGHVRRLSREHGFLGGDDEAIGGTPGRSREVSLVPRRIVDIISRNPQDAFKFSYTRLKARLKALVYFRHVGRRRDRQE
jgi:hypothetical protein